jgi:hypothetical protein
MLLSLTVLQEVKMHRAIKKSLKQITARFFFDKDYENHLHVKA